jgi:copper homeostasis protein
LTTNPRATNELPARRILLEVCIASVDDAHAAQASGAYRLELNAALALGGLTPSLGLLLEVKRAVALPVVAMLRPRPSGFAYSPSDFDVMRRDLNLLLANGADGVAFGILQENGTIDDRRCRILLEQMGSAHAVFHRAFDVTPEPFAALEQLIALGFRRVLTSGQKDKAENGAELIAELIRRAAGRIEILPGGGINRFTVAGTVRRTGCDQVHASLRHARRDPSISSNPIISFGAPGMGSESHYDSTDAVAVAELCDILRGHQHRTIASEH